jgi:hypothetical protein
LNVFLTGRILSRSGALQAGREVHRMARNPIGGPLHMLHCCEHADTADTEELVIYEDETRQRSCINADLLGHPVIMNEKPNRVQHLRVALVSVGVIFVIGIFPLTIIWPSGWRWHTEGSEYLQMILGMYATLGVFLIIASRNPLTHQSLIWFTVWSSAVHGAIMVAQVLADRSQTTHLWGDIPALFLIAAVLGVLTVRAGNSRSTIAQNRDTRMT